MVIFHMPITLLKYMLLMPISANRLDVAIVPYSRSLAEKRYSTFEEQITISYAFAYAPQTQYYRIAFSLCGNLCQKRNEQLLNFPQSCVQNSIWFEQVVTLASLNEKAELLAKEALRISKNPFHEVWYEEFQITARSKSEWVINQDFLTLDKLFNY